MVLFNGNHEHSIDAKHRLAIPADFRAEVENDPERRADRPVVLYVMPGEYRSIAIYTESQFRRRAEEISKNPDKKAALLYAEVFFPLTHKVEIDKQGRVLLPETLFEHSDVKQDVVLIGMNDHMEVHDRTKWKERLVRRLAESNGSVMNPERAISNQEMSQQP